MQLVAATRSPERAGLQGPRPLHSVRRLPARHHLPDRGGRALAYLRGRDYVLPEDVMDVAPDVLRHRVVPSYEALAEGLTADEMVRRIMRAWRPRSKVLERMAASPRTPEAILRRLEWTVVRRLEGLLQGDYRSLFRGTGLDLADLREYQDHDDVRHIDWNVTARLQTPHVREYQEDREFTAWFLLDMSPSVDFGSRQRLQAHGAGEFVAVMARLLTGKGNRCGALLFSDGMERVVPPRGGRRQVLHLLDLLATRPRLVRSSHHRSGRRAARGGKHHPPPFAGLRGLRFHQPAGLEKGARPAGAPPRSGGGATARSAGSAAAGSRPAHLSGRRNRRADVRRHQ